MIAAHSIDGQALRDDRPGSVDEKGTSVSDKKAILVINAGDATGSAIARRFAKEGYVAGGGEAHGFGSEMDLRPWMETF